MTNLVVSYLTYFLGVTAHETIFLHDIRQILTIANKNTDVSKQIEHPTNGNSTSLSCPHKELLTSVCFHGYEVWRQ
jgi:hypothetical protein